MARGTAGAGETAGGAARPGASAPETRNDAGEGGALRADSAGRGASRLDNEGRSPVRVAAVMLPRVIIHTDGACRGNPGPGGWGAVLTSGSLRKELSGGSPDTTNNRMELQAAIEALGALKRECEVEIYTDSEYVKNGITKWVNGWKRNGWMTTLKQPVKNAELWRLLDERVAGHKVQWHWLKGHAGHKENERCDELARAEVIKWARPQRAAA